MAGSVPTAPIPVCDPHFHFWDHDKRPNENLGGIVVPHPVYLPSHLLEDGASLQGFVLTDAVHVETVVGQVEGGFKIDTVDETRWVASLAPETTGINLRIVGFVDLSQDDAEAVMDAHIAAAGGLFVGVRQILNYSAEHAALTWPQVPHGDYFTSPAFAKGMRALAARGLSFDLHANWFQLRAAAAFFASPDAGGVTVIVNHLGCPKLHTAGFTDEEVKREWEAGITALAALPRVFMKISCLEYVCNQWMLPSATHTCVQDMVEFVLKAFGADRVMFASNYPVDKHLAEVTRGGVAAHKAMLGAQYAAYARFVAGYSREDQVKMFHTNAARVYKLLSA